MQILFLKAASSKIEEYQAKDCTQQAEKKCTGQKDFQDESAGHAHGPENPDLSLSIPNIGKAEYANYGETEDGYQRNEN